MIRRIKGRSPLSRTICPLSGGVATRTPSLASQRPDQPLVDQQLDELDAQALDVHRVAVGEPADRLLQLIGAGFEGGELVQRKSTSSRPRGRPGRRSSGRRSGRRTGTSEPSSGVDLDPDDLGDDLAGLLDDDGVADPDVLAGDLVGVVQGRPLDRRARQRDGRQVGHGRQLARLADLDARSRRPSSPPARPRICRRSPTAGSCSGARDRDALAEVVDLDDEAVGLVVEVVPAGLPGLGVGDHLVDRVEYRTFVSG